MIKKFTFVLLTLVVAGSVAHAIDIKRIDTNEGPEIWLVEDHSNPVVSLHFAFKAGKEMIPRAKKVSQISCLGPWMRGLDLMIQKPSARYLQTSRLAFPLMRNGTIFTANWLR